MDRVAFIDIDGVLMTRRAWRLPGNAKIAAEGMDDLTHTIPEAAALITFDREAISWLNLLGDDGVRFVIHSNWRRTIGHDRTRTKLIDQGVGARHFHQDFCAPMRFTSWKIHDVTDWIDDHFELQDIGFERVRAAFGQFVVIDDEPLLSRGLELEWFPQVLTDPEIGLDQAGYEKARAMLGMA